MGKQVELSEGVGDGICTWENGQQHSARAGVWRVEGMITEKGVGLDKVREYLFKPYF